MGTSAEVVGRGGKGNRTATIGGHSPGTREVVFVEADFLDALLGHYVAGGEEDLSSVHGYGQWLWLGMRGDSSCYLLLELCRRKKRRDWRSIDSHKGM